MTLQELIEKNNFTIYRFSKLSSIPKTTLLDLCSGKTSINKSHASTIQKIAKTLDVTMEFIMSLEQPNNGYLELNIPNFLQESIINFKKNLDNDLFDIYFCTLQSDINNAEVNGYITLSQANYIREKYLGVTNND